MLPLSLFHFLLPISFLPRLFFLPLFNPIFEKFFAERAMMQILHLRLFYVQKPIKATHLECRLLMNSFVSLDDVYIQYSGGNLTETNLLRNDTVPFSDFKKILVSTHN